MWQDVAEAVRVGADRVSGSLNEYGPPMELPAFASAWNCLLYTSDAADE